MASYGATHRPSVAPSSSPQPNDQYEKSRKDQFTFQITIPFSIPSTPESAATRIIRNLEKFKLYYFEFIWLLLFIALIPRRKVSLIILAATKEGAIIYLLLMRAVPASLVMIHKILDKRLILSLLALGTGIALIATRSGLHLVITLVATMPIILAHAGLWSGWADTLENNNVDEYTPLL